MNNAGVHVHYRSSDIQFTVHVDPTHTQLVKSTLYDLEI